MFTIYYATRIHACRDLLPVPPNPGDVPSCAEGGVLGILPGVVGCIQATEVIKVLLDKGSVLSGRLLVYDAVSACTAVQQQQQQWYW
jgi:molybdopterin/thiamine biosynthesis adenylyltransferase